MATLSRAAGASQSDEVGRVEMADNEGEGGRKEPDYLRLNASAMEYFRWRLCMQLKGNRSDKS